MILSSALIGSYLIKNKMEFKDKTLDKEKISVQKLLNAANYCGHMLRDNKGKYLN